MASSVKYYRDDAALTILGNLTEQNSENTQTLADVSVRLSTLEDSSTISVMGSGNSYAAGLVLAGNSTHGNEFLRKDGTWVATSVAGLAPLASPAFIGNPTAPTQTANDNTTKIATTAYVASAINDLVEGAPGQLSTLDNLAAALGDDANYASATAAVIAGKAPLASPEFTGTPKAPNQTAGNSTTNIANTSFVSTAITNLSLNSKVYASIYATATGAFSTANFGVHFTHEIFMPKEGGGVWRDTNPQSDSNALSNANMIRITQFDTANNVYFDKRGFVIPRNGVYCINWQITLRGEPDNNTYYRSYCQRISNASNPNTLNANLTATSGTTLIERLLGSTFQEESNVDALGSEKKEHVCVGSTIAYLTTNDVIYFVAKSQKGFSIMGPNEDYVAFQANNPPSAYNFQFSRTTVCSIHNVD